MTNDDLIAFADEFGNNSFHFETESSHFIVASIICKKENLPRIEKGITDIRKKHNFQTGEMKSSKVASNYSRRIKILEDIVKLDITILAVVVDKKKLYGEGFQYKKSFYKFIQNLLYKELFRTYPQLELHVDEYGDNDFLREFKKYVSKNHQRTLFSGSEFNIANSKGNYFIQLADFIAGTLGYIYDETKKNHFSDKFYEILKPKIGYINFFPNTFKVEDFLESTIDENFDLEIAKISTLRAIDFLEKAKGTDQKSLDQINLVKLLLLYLRVGSRNSYISTNELFYHLNQNRTEKIKEEYFRSNIVGKLRDKGLLISSSSKGYKIPTSTVDMEKFIRHGKRIIIPMLNRIEKARDIIKSSSLNKIDLLQKAEFLELKKFLEK